MSLFSSFFILLLILVQSSPPTSASISRLGTSQSASKPLTSRLGKIKTTAHDATSTITTPTPTHHMSYATPLASLCTFVGIKMMQLRNAQLDSQLREVTNNSSMWHKIIQRKYFSLKTFIRLMAWCRNINIVYLVLKLSNERYRYENLVYIVLIYTYTRIIIIHRSLQLIMINVVLML